MTKFTAIKSVDGVRTGPGVFPQAVQVTLHIRPTGEGGWRYKKEFEAEGLELNFVSGSQYLEAYLGPQEELALWVKPHVEAWAHGVRVLVKISRRQP